MKKNKEKNSELEKALQEVKYTIIGNLDWGKGQKIFDEQLSRDVTAGKLNLDFINNKK